MKRTFILSVFLSLVLAVSAAAATVSGKCGIDATFSYDTVSGVLEIGGKGDIRDYTYSETLGELPPWYEYMADITELTVSSGITRIGDFTFYKCSALESVSLPDSIKSLGINCFGECKKLTQISLPDKIEVIPSCAFIRCESLKNIKLPKNLERIERFAFSYCLSLNDVELPDSLIVLNGATFNGCTSLESIVLPQRVIGLYADTFLDCSSLRWVYIPGNVNVIEYDPFRNCENITIYGEKVSKAERFANNYGLTFVHQAEPPLKTKGNCGENMTWSFNEETGELLISGRGRMNSYSYTDQGYEENVPQPWEGLRDKILSVRMEGPINNLGTCAFLGCKNLKEVTLPSNIGIIGSDSFRYCNSLKAIELPKSVYNIGTGAFMYCTDLERIRIPNYVEQIMFQTFLGCESLKEIVLPASLSLIGDKSFLLCESLERIDIPYGTQVIKTSAFASCKALETVVIPDSVKSIGMGIVNGCDRVTVYTDSEYAKRILEKDHILCLSPLERLKAFEKNNAYGGQFSDVKDGDWFEKNVKCAFETALMLGTSDTEFSPNDNVTLAQAVTLAARIHSIYRTGKADFEQEGVWYSVYVDYLERNNMKSFSQYTDLNKEATREEVVNILYTALPRGAFKAINSIAQIPDYQWSASAVLDFYNAGILTGSDENRSFKPNTYITRAEISAIVTRMIDAELRVKLK